MYLWTKKETPPSAMAYLPAEAPADEPWMRGLGYKKAISTPESRPYTATKNYDSEQPLNEQYRQSYNYDQQQPLAEQYRPTLRYDSNKPQKQISIPSSMLRWRG